MLPAIVVDPVIPIDPVVPMIAAHGAAPNVPCSGSDISFPDWMFYVMYGITGVLMLMVLCLLVKLFIDIMLDR